MLHPALCYTIVGGKNIALKIPENLYAKVPGWSGPVKSRVCACEH